MPASGQDNGSAVLRIGELSRRVGVSEHVLRAWEGRYGLLKPARSEGGYRLYSEADARRIRRMQTYLAGGLAAAQAARAAIDEDQSVASAVDAEASDADPAELLESADALRQALDTMDEPAAQASLDRLLTAFTVETVLRDALVPYLHELGERWSRGAVSVAQEHFASHVIRGRLASLARGWGNGLGPYALLACPPGEEHDLALLIFGIVLNRCGWRVAYLGADTPMDDVIATTGELRPRLVLMAATAPERFSAVGPALKRLGRLTPLALAGAGASQRLADRVGAQLVNGDPVTAAETFRAR
jgi:MerR family transcriptional regulator, light-induced transcriptional regulator